MRQDDKRLKREAKEAQLLPPEETEEVGYVKLPVGKREFEHFIRSLLGSPQSLEGSVSGSFELEGKHLKNLHELLMQRITQQNEGFLIQFLAKINYSDGSSVELNDPEQLFTFNETRPVWCSSVYLTWDLVVKFQDKDFREKQRIEVSFEPEQWMGSIHFRVEHTARSWGADIQALLTNYFHTLVKPQPKLRRWLQNNTGYLGLAVGIMFFLSGLLTSYLSLQRHALAQQREINSILTNVGNNTAALNAKLDYVARLVASGDWFQFLFGIFVFLLLALAISVGFGIWIGSIVISSQPSFILLTQESLKHKEEVLKSQRREWLTFSWAIAISLLCDIVANILFAIYFE